MKTKGFISAIIGMLPNAVDYKVVNPKKSHYMIVDRYGRKYYLVITSRVLRYPPSININYDGEMFGINRRALYDIVRDGDYVLIMWGHKKENKVYVYATTVNDVSRYVKMFSKYKDTTCRRVKGTDEVVCHYPVAYCKFLGVVGGRTLTEYFRGGSSAQH